MFFQIQSFTMILKFAWFSLSFTIDGSMLNNFAPLYEKPVQFFLALSGTLRSLFAVLLCECWFWCVYFVSICSEDDFLIILKVSKIVWYTLICRCINTPVKRQYINALFEMAVYHRKRVATIINFLSFISIDIKGFPFNFGRKIFTGFEMTELQSWSISFFDILCSKIVEKSGSVTFKIWHFKASEDFSTKIKWEPLDINTNEWQEHSMLNPTWMPIKVLQANSMLVGIKKSWGSFPIKQKSNTRTAFVDSENCEN